MHDKIEILPVYLLDEHRALVGELKDLAADLGLEFGWHYLLDLTWIISQMQIHQGMRVMDAGAGVGVMQWYLAHKGVEVVSVDRLDRAHMPLRFRLRFQVQGLREGDLAPVLQSNRYREGHERNLVQRVASNARDIFKTGLPGRAPGRVLIYNQDLKYLADIRDDSLDYVVAVSALEHNPPENLKPVVVELMRVLKPGGRLLVTLGAARDQDWFHGPSKGWCYTEATLRQVFDLSSGAPSNYEHYDELFAALRDCAELREDLAGFYARSGDNGMPWGVWDPQYQPVGVCKFKPQGQ
jgi:ubiquinone/menaquinone biosynthesis C-methylase UbiE